MSLCLLLSGPSRRLRPLTRSVIVSTVFSGRFNDRLSKLALEGVCDLSSLPRLRSYSSGVEVPVKFEVAGDSTSVRELLVEALCPEVNEVALRGLRKSIGAAIGTVKLVVLGSISVALFAAVLRVSHNLFSPVSKSAIFLNHCLKTIITFIHCPIRNFSDCCFNKDIILVSLSRESSETPMVSVQRKHSLVGQTHDG